MLGDTIDAYPMLEAAPEPVTLSFGARRLAGCCAVCPYFVCGWHRRAEQVRDVLGADRLLRETTLEGRAERRVAMRLQEIVQPLDFVNPGGGADA
jgi:hypothetical protein